MEWKRGDNEGINNYLTIDGYHRAFQLHIAYLSTSISATTQRLPKIDEA